jgi:hypothetical protein
MKKNGNYVKAIKKYSPYIDKGKKNAQRYE